MIYRDEDGYDLKCSNGHLVRSPKGSMPVRCPAVRRTGGWCEATEFVVLDKPTADRERAALRSKHRDSDTVRYSR